MDTNITLPGRKKANCADFRGKLNKTLSDFPQHGCLMVEMHEPSDVQLLRDYAADGREAAFRELVVRHTDLVYSAALRQVNSPDLAGDIAQGVFTDLARKAGQVAQQMIGGHSLAGWLHRSTRYAALNHWRDTRRRLANEREAMEQLLINADSAPDWEGIRPLLDEALDNLDDEDREVLLLRYFKNQDFRTVGNTLGLSDDTAQKRVSRALDRLREFFSKRQVTIGAGGLVGLISANAVQAAPVGLAATIASAAIISRAVVATSAAITTTKIFAMTTLQKALAAVTVAVLAGTGIYEAHLAAQLRERNRALQQQQTPLMDELQQLRHEREGMRNQLTALTNEMARLKKNPSEVLKLRGEVGALRQEKAVADSQNTLSKALANPETRKTIREHNKVVVSGIYSELAKHLHLNPEKKGQFDDLLADQNMENIDIVMQALREGKSPAEVRQIFAASEAAFQGKVQALVGDDGLTQFQDYTKNLSSALFVNSFAPSLTGGADAVTDKKGRLLQAMQDATQSALAAAGLPANYQTLTAANPCNFASEDEASFNLQLKDNILAQTAERASAFLSADELNAFQTMRTNAIENTRNFILMERKLMAPAAP